MLFGKDGERSFSSHLKCDTNHWIKPQRNLLIGDIVLIKDENAPRNAWKLARVEEVSPSKDSLVRKAKLAIATSNHDQQGRRVEDIQFLDRPLQKLILIQEIEREVPDGEPC